MAWRRVGRMWPRVRACEGAGLPCAVLAQIATDLIPTSGQRAPSLLQGSKREWGGLAGCGAPGAIRARDGVGGEGVLPRTSIHVLLEQYMY